MGKLGIIMGVGAIIAVVLAILWFVKTYGFFDFAVLIFVGCSGIVLLLLLGTLLLSKRRANG